MELSKKAKEIIDIQQRIDGRKYSIARLKSEIEELERQLKEAKK